MHMCSYFFVNIQFAPACNRYSTFAHCPKSACAIGQNQSHGLVLPSKRDSSHHRLPKLEISHINNFPYKVFLNLVKISLTKKLKIKFTYFELALCLSLVCILGTIGSILEGFFAIVLPLY